RCGGCSGETAGRSAGRGQGSERAGPQEPCAVRPKPEGARDPFCRQGAERTGRRSVRACWEPYPCGVWGVSNLVKQRLFMLLFHAFTRPDDRPARRPRNLATGPGFLLTRAGIRGVRWGVLGRSLV